jgi:phosphopantothenoylcysteine decarboxylase/phosphopantothenate--cysteine ligase
MSSLPLSDKKILLGVCGGIAAYKSILLQRLLVKAGAEVQVVMTPSARDFVSPLVLSTLSGKPVLCEISNNDSWANHVKLGRWAHLMLIAPATCNTLAKMANGHCDNLLLAVYLSATCPVMIAPAMDTDMWKHPATNENLERLRQRGHAVLGVGHGDLASGLHGEGRLLEPEEIFAELEALLKPTKQILAGKKAIVTAGPTYESIDPVRFIGNHSSGLMGIELANALAALGAETYLVQGPGSLQANAQVHTIRVTSADEMFAAVQEHFSHCHYAVMAAAVADYKPATQHAQKIKKDADTLHIELVPNPDILSYCGANKRPDQVVVGFALETNNEEQNAIDKLNRKNADFMVMNSLRDEGAGFGTLTNKAVVYSKKSPPIPLSLQSKKQMAQAIVSLMIQPMHND